MKLPCLTAHLYGGLDNEGSESNANRDDGRGAVSIVRAIPRVVSALIVSMVILVVFRFYVEKQR